jgi:hypothetical protein
MKDKLKSKLLLGKFKSAYSPLYEEYVKIFKVRQDANDEIIIDATLFSKPGEIVLFRQAELQRYE